jgi:hypothetical protein
MLQIHLQFLLTSVLFATVQAELAPPFRIEVGGSDLVIEGGHSSVWMGDVNSDGLPDLAVTDQLGYGLRLYPNAGTPGHPKFGANYLEIPLQLLPGALMEPHFKPNSYPDRLNAGTTIQLVDLDQDDENDLLGATSAGITYWWKGLGQRKFGPPQLLTDQFPEASFSGATSVMAADMNRDGFLDFAYGGKRLRVSRGEKSQTSSISLDPARGGSGPRPLGGAALVMTDWDGDQKMDVVFATKYGALGWLKNITEQDERWQFAERQFFIEEGKRDPNSALPPAPGGYLRPWVVDWNGDGKSDIVTAVTSEEKVEAQQDKQKHSNRYMRARKGMMEAATRYEKARGKFLKGVSANDPRKLHAWAVARKENPEYQMLWQKLQKELEDFAPYEDTIKAESHFVVHLRL